MSTMSLKDPGAMRTLCAVVYRALYLADNWRRLSVKYIADGREETFELMTFDRGLTAAPYGSAVLTITVTPEGSSETLKLRTSADELEFNAKRADPGRDPLKSKNPMYDLEFRGDMTKLRRRLESPLTTDEFDPKPLYSVSEAKNLKDPGAMRTLCAVVRLACDDDWRRLSRKRVAGGRQSTFELMTFDDGRSSAAPYGSAVLTIMVTPEGNSETLKLRTAADELDFNIERTVSRHDPLRSSSPSLDHRIALALKELRKQLESPKTADEFDPKPLACALDRFFVVPCGTRR